MALAHERYAEVVHRLAGSQKSPTAVPAYTRFVNRPLGRRLAALGYLAGWTPDQVSLFSLAGSCAGLLVLCLAPIAWWLGLVVGGLLLLGLSLIHI